LYEALPSSTPHDEVARVVVVVATVVVVVVVVVPALAGTAKPTDPARVAATSAPAENFFIAT
jgi:hypothetical protein